MLSNAIARSRLKQRMSACEYERNKNETNVNVSQTDDACTMIAACTPCYHSTSVFASQLGFICFVLILAPYFRDLSMFFYLAACIPC